MFTFRNIWMFYENENLTPKIAGYGVLEFSTNQLKDFALRWDNVR
jgi:hypothetical protein